jgi:hypothetical protein
MAKPSARPRKPKPNAAWKASIPHKVPRHRPRRGRASSFSTRVFISTQYFEGLAAADPKAKAIAQQLDGRYLLKTDRADISAHEGWRIYALLRRAEHALRDMESPLAERPISPRTSLRSA